MKTVKIKIEMESWIKRYYSQALKGRSKFISDI